jgi:hypothetical protein
MSFIFIVLNICFFQPSTKEPTTEINLTEIEIYQPAALSVHKLKQHYLLSATLPNEKLLVVDRSGKLLFQYLKEGLGPGELDRNSVLTITKDEIYVFSSGPGVLIFDYQLNLLPKTEEAKKLKRDFAMVRPSGVPISESEFLVYRHEFLDHHLFIFSIADALGEGIWEPREIQLKKYFNNRGIKDPEIGSYHRGCVFTYRVSISEKQSEYEVFVHNQINSDWKMKLKLVGSVEDLKPWLGPTKGVINHTFKLDSGYLIEVAGAHPTSKSMFDSTKYYDFFDEQGQFKRRVIKLNHMILPVSGSPELLVLDSQGEDDILRTFDVDTLIP